MLMIQVGKFFLSPQKFDENEPRRIVHLFIKERRKNKEMRGPYKKLYSCRQKICNEQLAFNITTFSE